jgi:hypothetical protein
MKLGLVIVMAVILLAAEQPKRGAVRYVTDINNPMPAALQRNVQIYTGKEWVWINSEEGKRVAKEAGVDLL